MVTVHTPSSPFVIGCGLPSISPTTLTSLAFGARNRSVNVLSGLTCGDTSAPRPPPRPAGAGVCPAGGGVWGADVGAWPATTRLNAPTISTAVVTCRIMHSPRVYNRLPERPGRRRTPGAVIDCRNHERIRQDRRGVTSRAEVVRQPRLSRSLRRNNRRERMRERWPRAGGGDP